MSRGPLTLQFSIDSSRWAKWIKLFPDAVGHALYEEGQDILAASQKLVPVRTGALRNSGQVVMEQQGDTYQVVIGYGGPAIGYAVKVHEDPNARHAPPTQWKFLEGPLLYAASHGMDARIASRARAILNGFGINASNAQAVAAGEDSAPMVVESRDSLDLGGA